MNPNSGKMLTDLGVRSIYDAASQCSRCGYCEQACPTYVASGSETQSPRGRNQALRLLLEGKLKDPASAQAAFATCLLCGACSTVCYAHIPTAELVLEGRRMLSERPSPLARLLTYLLIQRPGLLAALLKLAYWVKRKGLSRLARPWLRRIGYSGLAVADEHVDEAPEEFLFEILRHMPEERLPAWIYFAACGSNYLYPRVGVATVKALTALKGSGKFLDNSCCGLLPYNYGKVEDARVLAKRVIVSAEKTPSSTEPIIADCSSCVGFLKSYPQLFLEDPYWEKKATAFAARIKDVAEIFGEDVPGAETVASVTYHDSCRARHGQGLSVQPRQVMRKLLGESYRELPEADVCCGGAGAFAFLQPELSDQILRRKIGRIAETGSRVVAASSTSCLLQLAHGLKKYYPECRVAHLSELVAEAVEKHGTKAGA